MSDKPQHFGEETTARLAVFYRLAKSVEKLTKDAELLYDGKIGQEEFTTRADAILKDMRQ